MPTTSREKQARRSIALRARHSRGGIPNEKSFVEDIESIDRQQKKWKLELIGRNDLMSLSERASKVTGIPMPNEMEKDAIERILE